MKISSAKRGSPAKRAGLSLYKHPVRKFFNFQVFAPDQKRLKMQGCWQCRTTATKGGNINLKNLCPLTIELLRLWLLKNGKPSLFRNYYLTNRLHFWLDCSSWRWNFQPTRYITIFLRRIQRVQIFKIPTDRIGTLIYTVVISVWCYDTGTNRLV